MLLFVGTDVVCVHFVLVKEDDDEDDHEEEEVHEDENSDEDYNQVLTNELNFSARVSMM